MEKLKKQIPDRIKDSICRCVEQIQIEGNSVLQMPEQFTAVLFMKLWEKSHISHEERILEGTFLALHYDWKRKLKEYFQYIKTEKDWDRILEEVYLTESDMLLKELWNLAALISKEYETCSLSDCSRLGEIMEYILDVIFRKGHKECFFTPSNVAELMLDLLAPEQGIMWDPACGSGTFLWKTAEMIKAGMKQSGETISLRIEGTDINMQMIKIARINLFFHGFDEDIDSVCQQDALERNDRFDYILSNPPVSSAAAGMQEKRGHIVETKALHLQFIQHIMLSLKPQGQAVVLVNDGLLFSTKTAEYAIRKALVEEYALKIVISLPQGVFAPYTNSKASILIFGGGLQYDEPIFFYEAEDLGYSLDKNRSIIEENDIPDILQKAEEKVSLYQEWQYALQRGIVYNADGIVVPAEWEYKKCWFADRKRVAEEKYILLADRYKPRAKEERAEQESPMELVHALCEMEQEIQEQLNVIARMTEEE